MEPQKVSILLLGVEFRSKLAKRGKSLKTATCSGKGNLRTKDKKI